MKKRVRAKTHPIERKKRPIGDGKESTGGGSHLNVDTGSDRLGVADGGHVDDQQVDSLLLQLVHRLVVQSNRTGLPLGPAWDKSKEMT